LKSYRKIAEKLPKKSAIFLKYYQKIFEVAV